jgi:translation elongation factor EF-Tu-like GTPase
VSTEPYSHIAARNGFLRATLTLRRTDEGGRKSGIYGDYRPNWSVGSPDPGQQSGAPVVIDSAERVEPGESAQVRLFPIWAEFWADVNVGTELFAFEGVRLVGRAVVTDVVAPADPS